MPQKADTPLAPAVPAAVAGPSWQQDTLQTQPIGARQMNKRKTDSQRANSGAGSLPPIGNSPAAAGGDQQNEKSAVVKSKRKQHSSNPEHLRTIQTRLSTRELQRKRRVYRGNICGPSNEAKLLEAGIAQSLRMLKRLGINRRRKQSTVILRVPPNSPASPPAPTLTAEDVKPTPKTEKVQQSEKKKRSQRKNRGTRSRKRQKKSDAPQKAAQVKAESSAAKTETPSVNVACDELTEENMVQTEAADIVLESETPQPGLSLPMLPETKSSPTRPEELNSITLRSRKVTVRCHSTSVNDQAVPQRQQNSKKEKRQRSKSQTRGQDADKGTGARKRQKETAAPQQATQVQDQNSAAAAETPPINIVTHGIGGGKLLVSGAVMKPGEPPQPLVWLPSPETNPTTFIPVPPIPQPPQDSIIILPPTVVDTRLAVMQPSSAPTINQGSGQPETATANSSAPGDVGGLPSTSVGTGSLSGGNTTIVSASQSKTENVCGPDGTSGTNKNAGQDVATATSSSELGRDLEGKSGADQLVDDTFSTDIEDFDISPTIIDRLIDIIDEAELDSGTQFKIPSNIQLDSSTEKSIKTLGNSASSHSTVTGQGLSQRNTGTGKELHRSNYPLVGLLDEDVLRYCCGLSLPGPDEDKSKDLWEDAMESMRQEAAQENRNEKQLGNDHHNTTETVQFSMPIPSVSSTASPIRQLPAEESGALKKENMRQVSTAHAGCQSIQHWQNAQGYTNAEHSKYTQMLQPGIPLHHISDVVSGTPFPYSAAHGGHIQQNRTSHREPLSTKEAFANRFHLMKETNDVGSSTVKLATDSVFQSHALQLKVGERQDRTHLTQQQWGGSYHASIAAPAYSHLPPQTREAITSNPSPLNTFGFTKDVQYANVPASVEQGEATVAPDCKRYQFQQEREQHTITTAPEAKHVSQHIPSPASYWPSSHSENADHKLNLQPFPDILDMLNTEPDNLTAVSVPEGETVNQERFTEEDNDGLLSLFSHRKA